jgi:hypothetical protein
MRSFGKRILSGLSASLPSAIFWGLFASVLYTCADDPRPGQHESLPNLLILYFSVAIVCGAVYGLLKDWTTTNPRFAVMSIVIALPWAAALMLMVNDWQVSRVEMWQVLLFGVLGVALGPPVGFYLRSQHTNKPALSKRDDG